MNQKSTESIEIFVGEPLTGPHLGMEEKIRVRPYDSPTGSRSRTATIPILDYTGTGT